MGRRAAKWRRATAQSGRRGRDSDGADEPHRSCDLPETPSRAAARECRHALRRSGTRGSRGPARPSRGRAAPGSLRAREIAAARGLPASTDRRGDARCRRHARRRSRFRPESVLRPKRARLTPAPSRGRLRRVLAVEPADLAKLPATPGVYLFMDTRGRLLYIGRASNLRSRIRSYWNVGLDRPGLRGMVRRVRRILAGPCVSEHEAALLERTLLERLDPPFNRTTGFETVVGVRLSSTPPGS